MGHLVYPAELSRPFFSDAQKWSSPEYPQFREIFNDRIVDNDISTQQVATGRLYVALHSQDVGDL